MFKNCLVSRHMRSYLTIKLYIHILSINLYIINFIGTFKGKFNWRHTIQFNWCVSWHQGILGNERADELAKKGAYTPFTEPDPVLGLPNSVFRRAI